MFKTISHITCRFKLGMILACFTAQVLANENTSWKEVTQVYMGSTGKVFIYLKDGIDVNPAGCPLSNLGRAVVKDNHKQQSKIYAMVLSALYNKAEVMLGISHEFCDDETFNPVVRSARAR